MTKQIILLSMLPAAPAPKIPLAAAQSSVPGANWEKTNYDGNGGSNSPQTQITKSNVQYLEVKWLYPYSRPDPKISKSLEAFGSLAPAIVVDGVVYTYMNDKRLLALDASTGKEIWKNDYGNTLDLGKQIADYPYQTPRGAHGHAIYYYRDKGWIMPSTIGSCITYAVDAKTGKTAWTMGPELMCGTVAELGNPLKDIVGSLGNQGFYSGLNTNPPVFLGNIMFYPIAGSSGQGGRSFVTAFDMTDPQNPKRLYREFIQPPAQGDPNWAINECTRVNGNGWYFEYPRYLEGINHPTRNRDPTYLATKCTDAPADVVQNDGMDMVPGSPTFGRMHTATNHGSAVWGNYPIDPETGIVYLGWGDQGPYTNLTNRYGPGLHGSGMTAFDIKTGKMVWWFQAVIHDMWDYDCSWNGMLGKTSAGQKIYIKGCKSGTIYGLDAATGKPIWIFDAPTIRRSDGANYGVDKNNDPKGKDACCRLTKADMGKPWMTYPDKTNPIGPISCYTHCLEQDLAFDGKYVYGATHNVPVMHRFGPVVKFGNNGAGGNNPFPPGYDVQGNTNMDLWKVDVNTGKPVWSYRVNGVARGGITVTGGFVILYATDGILKFVDADTGKEIQKVSYGINVDVQPTVGATKDGKMLVLVAVGGGGRSGLTVDGALVAYGLPDKIPEPQVVTKEVIKEVPKEVIKEVIKEVPKEVIRTVTVETVSPFSYAAIGIGVVLVVVAGILFSRRKKA